MGEVHNNTERERERYDKMSTSNALSAGGPKTVGQAAPTAVGQPPLFSGERADWPEFRLMMRVWLRRRNIDITESGLAALQDTDAANVELGDYLLLALPSSARSHVGEHEGNGKAIWAALQERFERLSLTEIIQIRAQLAEVTISDAHNIEAYIETKRRLINQLRSGGVKWEQEDCVIELLTGLGSAYDTVCGQMEMEPKGNRTMARCEELLRGRARILLHSRNVESAHATRISSTSVEHSQYRRSRGAGSRRSGNRRCTVCGDKSHDRTKCPHITCFQCGKKGHVASQCDQTAHANATAVVADTRSASAVQPGIPPKEASGMICSEPTPEYVALTGQDSLVPADALRAMHDHDGFLVDSGTSANMTPHRHLFTQYMPWNGIVKVASSHQLPIVGRGTIQMRCLARGGECVTIAFEALHVEGLAFNLFSTDWVVDRGGTAVLSKQPYLRWPDGTELACERWPPRTLLMPATEAHMTIQQLHERLNHVNDADCRTVARALDIDVTGKRDEKCVPCLLGKAQRQPIPRESHNQAKLPLERVCVDAGGPYPRGIQGHRHILMYIDEASGCGWPYFARNRGEFPNSIEPFVSEVGVPHVLRCDNAPELVGGQFYATWRAHGVREERTARASPQQNGKCERRLATIMADCRTLLQDSGLPDEYWPYAAAAASTSRNIVQLAKLEGRCKEIAVERCRVPPPDMWRAWGCVAIVHEPTAKDHGKLLPRGKRMIFIGHRPGAKAWLFVNPATKRVITSRDAVFIESQTGAVLLQKESREMEPRPQRDLSWLDMPDARTAQSVGTTLRPIAATPRRSAPRDLSTPSRTGTPRRPEIQRTPTPAPTGADKGTNPPARVRTPPLVTRAAARRAAAAAKEASDIGSDTDIEVDDGDAGAELGWDQFDEELLADAALRACAPSPEPLATNEQDDDHALAMEVACYAEVPNSYLEAMQSDKAEKWREAIAEELSNHAKYKSWVLVPRDQASGRVLTSGWTFNIKLDQGGTQLRYKARLYVRGCHQTATQYTETTAPVTNLITLRLLLHRAVSTNAYVVHIDVKAAYLNAPVSETLFMRVPDGVEAELDQVCLIQKSIYGLKQAGANWHQLLTDWLMKEGFVRSETDPCAFVLKGSVTCYITVYVDDMILLSEDQRIVQDVVERMQKKFTVKVTDLKVYLAQRITMTSGRVRIDMGAYVKEILRDFGLHHANRTAVPCAKTNESRSGTVERARDASGYRSVVGQLQWLCQTARPDLTFALHLLSRAVSSPTVENEAGAKKAMRYLVGTVDVGIELRGGGELVGFVDSDWATELEGRRSVSGFVIGYLHGDGHLSPIVWRSKRQTCVASSTCEAEYIACHEIAREVCYLRQLLSELGVPCHKPTRIFCDNRAAVLIGNNDTKHVKHARYIDIRFHFARHCQREGRVVFVDIDSKDNLADAFTKALPRDRFRRLTSKFTSVREGEC